MVGRRGTNCGLQSHIGQWSSGLAIVRHSSSGQSTGGHIGRTVLGGGPIADLVVGEIFGFCVAMVVDDNDVNDCR